MSNLIVTVLIITTAILLLSLTRMRPDLIALMVLLSLGISGVVDQKSIFSGFSSSAVMTILGISMISVALQQTGAASYIGRIIYKLGRRNETLLILLVSIISAILSLFMNNIAAVGVLMPAVMSLSRRSQTSPSRLLMPLAFGTILGGMATLLTTSNIIVSGALKDAGYSGFGLLDYFPVGAPVAVFGILYLITLGRKLLPKSVESTATATPKELSERLQETYQIRDHLEFLKILPNSPLIGKTINSSELKDQIKPQVLRIIHKNNKPTLPIAETILQDGDVLIINGLPATDQLETLWLENLPKDKQLHSLADPSLPLAEVILSPRSSLIGKTLCEIDFRVRYGLIVLGIWRRGAALLNDLSNLKLEAGDALLIQGSAQRIRQIESTQELILLEEDPDAVLRPRKLIMSVIITLFTLTFAALDILPVALVVLGGAVLLVLTGCMNLNDAFQKIEWKAIFLIAGMWPLTIAISESGLAASIIEPFMKLLNGVSPLVIVAFFMLLAMLFTQFLSGPVAPIIIIPLALTAAKTFGIDPHPLAIAVALGCSLAFITPLAHPVNIMVMNPGGYSFKDFMKIGLPLTLISILVILLGIHFIYGL